MSEAAILRVRAAEAEEEWLRQTDDDDIRGSSALRVGEIWRVRVNALEFIRQEPLEYTIRDAVTGALMEVRGVVDLSSEDRELWRIAGTPSGEDLLAAVGRVTDELADDIRDAINLL